MSGCRCIQRSRDSTRSHRRASLVNEPYRTPENQQNDAHAASSASASGAGASIGASGSSSSLRSSQEAPPSTGDFNIYTAYSEDDPNLDIDEAGGVSDFEGET